MKLTVALFYCYLSFVILTYTLRVMPDNTTY